MSKEKFSVGQQVWFEPNDKRDKGFYATISKVGRVYYTVKRDYGEEIKFDKETLCRSEYPDGHLYISEQEAKDYHKAKDMFLNLIRRYDLKPTLEQMEAIYKILNLEILNDE